MARSNREKAMLGIALIGVLLCIYAIPLHYATGGSSLCDISKTVNCDTVNRSTWSELFGIPVAILGLICYLAFFLIVFKRKSIERALSFTRKDFAQYLLLFAGVMFLFQLYLTITEIFFIHAYCIICLTSQVCTLLLLVLAAKEYREN